MRLLPIETVAWKVIDAPGLDSIDVYWRECGRGCGAVTICCFGSAWTAYWGGMGDRTIKQFFLAADTSYLVNKLGITSELKARKCDLVYLGRIVDAIKAAFSEAKEEPK